MFVAHVSPWVLLNIMFINKNIDLQDWEVVGALGLNIILFHSKHVKQISPLAALSFSCGKIPWVSLGEASSFRPYKESVSNRNITHCKHPASLFDNYIFIVSCTVFVIYHGCVVTADTLIHRNINWINSKKKWKRLILNNSQIKVK